MSKLYEDLSNDDLIDLLVSGSLVLVPPGSTHKDAFGRGSSSLAGHLPVHQDAVVARQQARRLDLVSNEPQDDARYRPLDSVWYGEEDADLIEQLLRFYPRSPPRLILDATVNGRRFWRGSSRPVIGLDIDRRHSPKSVQTIPRSRSGLRLSMWWSMILLTFQTRDVTDPKTSILALD